MGWGVDTPAALAGMVVLYVALLTKLLLTRSDTGRAGLRMLTFALLMLAGSMTADLTAIYHPLDVALGSVNAACLLVYGQAMASVWAFYMVLDRYLARCLPAAGPVEQGRPSGARGGLGVREPADAGGSRRGYLELTAAIGITLGLFPFGPAQVPDVPKLDSQPLTTAGTAVWFGVVVLTASWFTVQAMLGALRAAAYAAKTGRSATAVGLRLVAVGGLFGLVNVNYQSFAHPLLPSGTDSPLANLLTALGFLGAGSAALGVCLPALAGGTRSTGLASWWRTRRDYRALQPLWRDLIAAVPTAALHGRPPRWRPELAVRDVDYLLYRRVIELRDCVLALQPDAVASPPTPTGQNGDRPACQPAPALLLQVAARANQLEPVDSSCNGPASSAGLSSEVRTFLALSRAYRRGVLDPATTVA